MKNKLPILIVLFISLSFVVEADRNEHEISSAANPTRPLIVSPQVQKQRDIKRGKILLWELERELRHKKKLEDELRIMQNEQRSPYLRKQIKIRLQNISTLRYELKYLRQSLRIKTR